MFFLKEASITPNRLLFQELGTNRAIVSVGLWAVFAWVLVKVLSLFLVEQRRRPRNVVLGKSRSFLGCCFTMLRCLIETPNVVLEEYSKACGKAFAISTSTNYHVYVSSLDQIKDISNAPGKQLSFNGVLADVVYPKYTMHGYSYNPEDPQNSWSVATLKSGLRSCLPSMRPALQQMLEIGFAREMDGKPDSSGWVKIWPASVAHKVICSLNTRVILGEEHAKNPGTVKAAADYARDAVITTEILQRIPSILHPLLGNILMRWSGAKNLLTSLIDITIRNRHSQPSEEKPSDLIQWMIDSPRKEHGGSALAIKQRILGFIFGSAYQMPMFVTFCLYRLCKHPEYWRQLREEIALMSPNQVCSNLKEDTPFLDSFLKETARLHPLQAGSADRKVMTPFTFSDGTYVPAGNYIRIAQHALMLDPEIYSNPTEFDPFRFILRKDVNSMSQSRLSHPSATFPFWGSVGRACPGRFYVTMITKMVVIYIINNYDLKLVDEKANPSWAWGTNIVPNPTMRILVRPRCVE